MSTSIKVENPGMLTTVQDRGRFGHYHLGIPQSGAMDDYSAQAANALVGNDRDCALLECTYVGPTLTFEAATSIAITGAPVEAKIDGTAVPLWTRVNVPAGARLSFGFIGAGTRFYIAVRGGIDVPLVLGSRSTYTPGKLGGVHGRKLEAGDVLSTIPSVSETPIKDSIPAEFIPEFGKAQQVRVLPGLYDHKLTETGRRNLFEESWALTPVADRGGLRYQGPGVEWRDDPQPFGAGADPSNIVDAGYAVGSIQIPGGTQPIVLHRDAVSAGGYAMVATVISADMDVVSRAAPGTETSFIEVKMEDALAARAARKTILKEMWAALEE